MANSPTWSEGNTVLLRGVFADQPVYIQSTRLIKDTPQETVLAIWPGAECAAPAGYLEGPHAAHSSWDRWGETFARTLRIEKYLWHSNIFLILLEPEKYFSTIYMWDAASREFFGYYINFQLPFRRTRLGFDTLDLDLDIVIEPSYRWRWKDVDEYRHAIEVGGIRPEWVSRVEAARKEIAARLSERLYPLDGAWRSWRPDPDWPLPCLPADWESAA